VKQSALATNARTGGNPFALSWVPEYVLRIQQIALNLQAIASNCNQNSQTNEVLRRIEAELSAHRDYFFRHSGTNGGQPA
jgi:pyrroloquinoline quinone (PQQ) biosynthesis protein C